MAGTYSKAGTVNFDGDNTHFLRGDGTWAEPSVAVSDYSAKGVILVGTGAGTFTAVTVGDDDDVLTADSGEASGVKWAAGGGTGTDYDAWSLAILGL